MDLSISNFLRNMMNSRNVNFLNGVIFGFLFIICLAIYFNGLNSSFILDDKPLIVENTHIKDPHLFLDIFKTDIFHFHHLKDSSQEVFYRPLQSLSYALDYSIWGMKSFGYRLTNVFLHSCISWFIFLFVFIIFKNRILALLTGIFFCVHPMQVCLVTFAAGRSNLLETVFMLLSLGVFIFYLKRHRKYYYAVSIFLFIAALLSREGALLLPFFMVLSVLILGLKKREIFLAIIPYIFIGALYMIFRSKFISSEYLIFSDIFSLKNLGASIAMGLNYFGQLILPIEFRGNSTFIMLTVNSAVFVGIVYALIRAVIYKDKVCILAAGIYLIGILPVIKLISHIYEYGVILCEHYVYISSIGFCLFISYMLLNLYRRFPKIGKTVIFTSISYLIILTIVNNSYYKDEITFYRHVLSIDENNNLVRVDLGTAYYEKKMYDQAIEQVRLVLASDPSRWDNYLLLGNIMKEKGNLDQAKKAYKKTLMLYPYSWEALNNLGLVYAIEGEDDRALDNFKKAVSINSETAKALKNLADFLFEKKDHEGALSYYEKVLAVDCNDWDSYCKIGVILARMNRYKEAEFFLKRALALNPKLVDAKRNLGNLYANSGNLDKAILVWQEALAIVPGDRDISDRIIRARRLLTM